jgi:hypothetical protein
MACDANRSAVWFGRVTWVGIAANLALAVPTLLVPQRMLGATGLPAVEPVLWLQFAALLLILLSAFYVPAALNPTRYRLVAWLAVGARLAGFLFFVFLQLREYRMFGYFDLAFFVPECALLLALGVPGSGNQRVLAGPSASWGSR